MTDSSLGVMAAVTPSGPASAPVSRRGIGVAVAAVVGLVLAGPSGSFALGVAVAVGPRLVARHRRIRATRRLGADVATVLELAARAVRSGVAFSEAIGIASAACPGPGADLVTGVFVRPLPTDPRLAASADGLRIRGPGEVVSAIVGMVRGTAGGTARGLEAGAMILRERERARGEVAAGIAQARTSALLLTAAPVVLGVMGTVLVSGGVGALARHPVAMVAATFGVVLELMGAWWTQRLIHEVEGTAT